MNFNSGKKAQGDFPAKAFVGDLWFDTGTRDLFVAVALADSYRPSQSDHQRAINSLLYASQYGFTVLSGPRYRVPNVGPVGTFYLTTDTFEAFAGTGLGVVQFNLDVQRALADGTPGAF